MPVKRFFLAGLAAYVTSVVSDFVVHGVLLEADYEATKSLWRPEMQKLEWIFFLVNLAYSFLFVHIFGKGYEGKGVVEGVRFGVVIGLVMSLGMAFGTYVMIAIPLALAVKWFVFGMIQYILVGVVISLIYRPERRPA